MSSCLCGVYHNLHHNPSLLLFSRAVTLLVGFLFSRKVLVTLTRVKKQEALWSPLRHLGRMIFLGRVIYDLLMPLSCCPALLQSGADFEQLLE